MPSTSLGLKDAKKLSSSCFAITLSFPRVWRSFVSQLADFFPVCMTSAARITMETIFRQPLGKSSSPDPGISSDFKQTFCHETTEIPTRQETETRYRWKNVESNQSDITKKHLGFPRQKDERWRRWFQWPVVTLVSLKALKPSPNIDSKEILRRKLYDSYVTVKR